MEFICIFDWRCRFSYCLIPSLKTKSRKRVEAIEYALPSFLDVLYVSVEAGLAFDMAIYRTTDKMKGSLSEELLFTMNEISKGRGRSEALREMVKRTQVPDLATFVTSIIQAEEMGSNIGNVLRIQADTMRLEQAPTGRQGRPRKSRPKCCSRSCSSCFRRCSWSFSGRLC